MRILHVVHSLPPYEFAGTPILTWQLARAQAEHHEVHLFCRLDDVERPDGGEHDEHRDGCRVRFFNRHTIPWTPLADSYQDAGAVAAFERFVHDLEPEVIHFQHLLGLGKGVLEAATRARVPVVYTLHDFWLQCPMGQRTCKTDDQICDPIDFGKCGPCVYGPEYGDEDDAPGGSRLRSLYRAAYRQTPGLPGRRPRAWLSAVGQRFREALVGRPQKPANPFIVRFEAMRDALAKVDLVIGTSAFICDQYRRGFDIPDERLLFLANGMDFDSVHPEPKTSAPKLRIGFVGSIIPTKGVRILLEGFLLASEETEDLELHIHGDPNRWTTEFHQALIDEAAASPHADRIQFHGGFDNTRIGEIHRDLDFLVVPSIWFENSPLVLNEAAMTQTPVIASDRGGMREFVETTGWGRTFELGNPASLAAVLVDLAREHASGKASLPECPPIKPIEQSAAQVVDVYRQLQAGTWQTPPLAEQLRSRGGILEAL